MVEIKKIERYTMQILTKRNITMLISVKITLEQKALLMIKGSFLMIKH